MALLAQLSLNDTDVSTNQTKQLIKSLVPKLLAGLESAQSEDWHAYAKQLIVLANLYTYTADNHSSFRGEIFTSLLQHIIRINGLEGMVTQSTFAANQLFYDIDHFADPRLACLRSAAGFAALALLNHPIEETSSDLVCSTDQAITSNSVYDPYDVI